MHVLSKGSWTVGYLDEVADAESLSIVVHRQVALAPVDNQFFMRQPKLAMLASYLRILGVRRVLRKVRSRRSEATRNDAWFSVGVGTPLDEDAERLVAFVVPSGPAGAERVVVRRELISALPHLCLRDLDPGHFLPIATSGTPKTSLAREAVRELSKWFGWSPEEGTSPALSEETWRHVVDLLAKPGPEFTEAPSPPPPSEVKHRSDVRPIGGERSSFHCFGYGQYAKTQVIPNLSTRLNLACVHEINPLQIGPVDKRSAWTWDTLPYPRPTDTPANAVVATYHHTHAPIATRLITNGARHVVVEKPLATSQAQLDGVLAALKAYPAARLHTAFQRRYSRFNQYLLEDIGSPPISMAAVIYEAPLPPRHWYRWPIVGNAIVSNGCHWIDHFLFLNGFDCVTKSVVHRLNSQVVMGIELQNGASATLSLRHIGAPRRGVRDTCTYWKDDASAVIVDSHQYTAERGYKQVRRSRCHPYDAHESMYREFARRIELDALGDDPRSIEVSTQTVLRLAELLRNE